MRVAIVDGYTLIRKSIVALLMKEQDIEVVGDAGTVKEAIELINNTRPEVVLIDMKLRDGNGLDIVDKCNVNNIPCKYVAISSSTSEVEFKNICQAGIDGYVLKFALPEELIYALRLVYRGRKYYDPLVMDCVIRNDEDPIEDLTPRELDVLLSLGHGMNNQQISKQLYITEFTVKKHISQILSKLNLRDRTAAALFANSRGLVQYEKAAEF